MARVRWLEGYEVDVQQPDGAIQHIKPGEVFEMPDSEAQERAQAGQVEIVKPQKKGGDG